MENIDVKLWPSEKEYPVNITKEQWKNFIEEVEYPKYKGCMRVLKCFLESEGMASPKQLSDMFGGDSMIYTSSVYNTSRRAIQYFDMKACPDGDKQRYFPIAFQGKHDRESGNYVYKMRGELYEALLEIDLSAISIESKNDDINEPMMPAKIEEVDGKTYLTCARCTYRFLKAPRCPGCGQLVRYSER